MTIVLNNIRSAWNVGAIMRTCDALSAALILVGYTPQPTGSNLKLIKKTAIGAEKTVNWQHYEHWQNVFEIFPSYDHFGIEISPRSQNVFDFLLSSKFPKSLDQTMLWFGNEIHGLEVKLCQQLQSELHLPMNGIKESLNVASTVCAIGYLFLAQDYFGATNSNSLSSY